jgi:Family of unknown function (DUF6314)
MSVEGGVFERLLGEWGFEREIPGRARMKGQARFTLLDEETALYEESGELRLEGGQRLQGRKSYVYEKRDDGFAVRFADTRKLFHAVRFMMSGDDLVAEASHVCLNDLYVSAYTVRPDGSFEVRHEVRGPQKDYVIQTLYRRRFPG